MTDFTLENHGTIAVLTPLTEEAEDWVVSYLPEDAQQWGRGVVIEPRYLPPIIEGIEADGMTIN